jgi:hypothetical protein
MFCNWRQIDDRAINAQGRENQERKEEEQGHDNDCLTLLVF